MPQLAAPAVSVCIPAYRGGAHLGAAIESVLRQTHTDFELVIIDDASPDDTLAVARRYADARIRLLQNAVNRGPQENWNRCLSEARGKYFKLLPQDDLLAPDCLEKQVAVLEQDRAQRIALVFCARTIIDAAGRARMVRAYAGADGPVAAPALRRQCLRRGTNLIGEPGAVLLRRQLADTVGRFDAGIPYVLDLDYWFRLLRHGQAYHLRAPLASFRVAPGSWSVAIGARQSADYRRFIRKVAGDAAAPASRLDIWCGNIMAELNTWLRLAFYRFVLN